jgi:hypothetical protein
VAVYFAHGNPIFDRWQKSWDGLHIQTGIATTAYNTDSFG